MNCRAVGSETAKNSTLEMPPPGPGLDTVIEAVLAVAMFDAGTVAFNCELLTRVVLSADRFQLIVAPFFKFKRGAVRLTRGLICRVPTVQLA